MITERAIGSDFRNSEPKLELCDELGIAFLAWSPLGGIKDAGSLGESGSR